MLYIYIYLCIYLFFFIFLFFIFSPLILWILILLFSISTINFKSILKTDVNHFINQNLYFQFRKYNINYLLNFSTLIFPFPDLFLFNFSPFLFLLYLFLLISPCKNPNFSTSPKKISPIVLIFFF